METLITTLQDYLTNDPDWKQVLLLGLTPIFLASLVFEYRFIRSSRVSNNFSFKDVLTNFSLGGSYQVFEVIYYALFIGAIFGWFHQFSLFKIEMNWMTWPLLIVGMEFFYYWFHRASHRIRWFWCAHVVHHSGEHMNMSTAMRQSLTYTLNLSHFFWVPLILIGFEPSMVMLALGINLAYQYFIHTESINKLHPVLEYVLNTPSHHRAHHGKNKQYIDKNYGGIIILYDRIFGTFVEEDEDIPVVYGIPNQIRSHNLIKLNFHEWLDMFHDAMKPGPIVERLKHFWAPPEWQRKTDVNTCDTKLKKSSSVMQ